MDIKGSTTFDSTNFTTEQNLALPQVGNLVCELIEKVKGQEDERPAD